MKGYLYLLCALLMLLSCGRTPYGTKEQSTKEADMTSTPCGEASISRDTAILIAKGDAVENYTLSRYNIAADEHPEGWRVVFKLKDPGVIGGGPDYLIDKKTGKILNATSYK